jgi:LPS-assembly lipoprotein
MRRGFLLTVILPLAALLAGCGFQLRGTANLPFNSIRITLQSPFGLELARTIASGSNAKVVERGEAQADFNLLGEQREKAVLSLDTNGQVREYQLRYRVSFNVTGPNGAVYIPTNTLILRRTLTFNNQVLAKAAEEEMLYTDMRSDMVQQILRRMQASKLHMPED